MASKFVVLGLMLFAVASARVVRDAPEGEGTSLSEIVEVAGKEFKELEATLLKAFGVENTEQLQKKVVDQGKQLATQLDVWAQDIKKETESLKDNEAVKELRESVDKALNEFKLNHPDTAEDIKTYVDKSKKGAEEIITKLKTLGESEEAKNVKELSQKLLDTAATTFQNIGKQIEESVKQ